jgi:hypothetical protein
MNVKNGQKGAKSMASAAQSYIKDRAVNATDIASETTKLIKNEGQKSLRNVSKYARKHPAKTALYAAGAAAVMTYIFMPRK